MGLGLATFLCHQMLCNSKTDLNHSNRPDPDMIHIKARCRPETPCSVLSDIFRCVVKPILTLFFNCAQMKPSFRLPLVKRWKGGGVWAQGWGPMQCKVHVCRWKVYAWMQNRGIPVSTQRVTDCSLNHVLCVDPITVTHTYTRTYTGMHDSITDTNTYR